MADNVTLSAGTADGAVIAADEVAGVWYQINKLAFGALDSVTLAASGAGAVSAGVQRVTLASDDPAVVSVQLIDDAIIADDAAFTPATTKVMMAGFEYDDIATDSVNEGDAGAARMSANRNIYVQIRDNAGNERGLNVDASGFIGVTDGGGSLTVDNSVLSVVGGGTEATAQRVTIASDSTGVLSVDDNGGSLTIDGSVSVSALPASTNTLEVVGDVAQDAAVGGNPVLIGGRASSAAPTDMSADGDAVYLWTTLKGALNIADGGGNISIDDGGNSITVDNGGTFATQENGAALTALQLIDNIVQVEDAAAAGGESGVMALAVRKDTGGTLASADGDFTPFQVDASGALRVTGGGGGTEYTEDAAAAADPVGNVQILVRADTPAGIASADGDNLAQRGTNYGAAYVTLLDTGGSPVSVGGGTQYTEDAAAAADPIGNAINLIRKDTPATITSADGDNVALRGSNYGAAYVTLIDNAGSFLSVGGGTQYTEDAAAAADPVGNAISLVRQDTLSATTVSADGDNIALRGASTGAAYVEVTAGTTKLGSATDGLLVNLGTNNDVTVTGTVTANLAAGTNNIGDVDVLSIAAGDNNIGNVDIVTMPNVTLAAGTNTNEVVGDVAHDGVAAGNPLLMGAYASAAAPTNVSADGDVTRIWALQSGAQVIQPSFAGVLATTGNGASGTGVQRVTIASDSTGLISVNPGTAANWGVYVEDAAETAGGNLAMAGSVRRDTAASSAGTSGDNATINTDANGALWTNLAPNTTGGLSVFMASGSDGSSILVATAQAAKASAGQVYGWYMYNPESAATFVHFYNTAQGSVTVGTTNPLFSIQLPATSASNVAFPHGIPFSTAITVAATTTAGGNTAPATGVSLELFYK